ncbi:MAG: ABC transporter ATP-binding protein, partial [Anaerolineae bacterium]
NAEKYDRQYTDRQLFTRIWDYFRPQSRRFLWVTVWMVVLGLILAALPVVVARLVDLLKSQPTVNAIAVAGVVLVVIAFANWGLNWARRALVVRAVGDVVLQLRARAFEAAAAHDLSFYDQFSSGRIVSRMTSDSNDFGQLVVIATDIGAEFIQLIILAVVMIRTEWHMALLLFSFMPFIVGIAMGFRSLARRVTRRGMQAMADVNAAIKETVSGISIAKNFRQENAIFGVFDAANQTSYNVNVRRGFVLSMVFPVMNAAAGIFDAILVYTGGLTITQGLITAGAWYLFLMSLDQFFFPIQNLSAFWAQIQQGLAAAERVYALIDADPNVVQTANDDVPKLRGEICFDHLRFQYTAKEVVLPDFSLCIGAGENIAFVGHTGAGKSSIAKLIARFYEFQGGLLTIDGCDIRTLDLQQYRRQLGIVSQVPFLFSGSVADNIRYALPSVTRPEMLAMAKRIGDGEWLETLPEGLDTSVGERGNRLSMGQRQLVALMRVLVQRPAIFILDEATASIDPFTEWQIQQALNLILHETTSILIAHRLSTVKAADRIIVMEQGRIIQEGSHDGLMQQGGHYATLYNTYFRHQSLAYRPEWVDEKYAGRLKVDVGKEGED